MNRVELFIDSKEFLPAMVSAIDAAKKSVSFQFLNMEADEGGYPIADSLIRAAKRGVLVKGMLDRLCLAFETNGQWSIWPTKYGRCPEVVNERRETQEMFSRMRRAGIELGLCLPGPKNRFTRNHRKSLVVDNQVLIVGGFNPTGHNRVWHEICVAVSGPAAAEAQVIFNEVFIETGGEPMSVSTAPAPTAGGIEANVSLAVNDPKTRRSFRTSFLELVRSAQKSIRVENAYFSDPAIVRGLCEAARRRLLVQLIVPSQSNHASIDRKGERSFPDLMKAGVEIYRYRGMTHAKAFSIDDRVISIGSANFTPLNLKMERELNIVASDSEGMLGEDFLNRFILPDIQNSDRVL